MKRRTSPRPAVPRPPVAPSLSRLFPDVLKMSDLQGYKMLYQLSVMCSEGPDAALMPVLMSQFLTIRGLSVHQTDEKFRGCSVVELRKGERLLASFSSAVG